MEPEKLVSGSLCADRHNQSVRILTTRRQLGQYAVAMGGLLLHAKSASAFQLPTPVPLGIPLQPFAAQARRIADALAAVGAPLRAEEAGVLREAASAAQEAEGVVRIAAVLDRRVLMEVRINPEARLSVTRGSAPANLVQGGWTTFLIRVVNEAAATSALRIRSPQGGASGRTSSAAIEGVHDFTNGAVDAQESRARWIALTTYDLPPMLPVLSGLGLEYRVLQVYSRDAGQREASLIADAGFGEQDLGFRSTLPMLFRCTPALPVRLSILDERSRPTTASLLIRDALQRVYPAQGKRDLPDLAFEPQIYRTDGEALLLGLGDYTVEFGRGPEYLRGRTALRVGSSSTDLHVQLQRWIDPSRYGYYSGDTHIHAAGCSHYESPAEGVPPEVMDRQVAGEALDLGSVLNWGPGFAYQRQFFSGHTVTAMQEPLHAMAGSPGSSRLAVAGHGLLRYDVEVSGFPSSHCGHLVLLRLQADTYPGSTSTEDWPSWNLPILQWAKAQGASTGYAHVGHGLVTDTTDLPNYVMPPFNSSGANEFLIDVTHPGTVDFLSGCDLWPFAELNVWYHSLNCGFRTTFAGETDFPCLTDECVGGGRTYARLRDGITKGDDSYSAWLSGLSSGDAYFGDGRSHIFDMQVTSEKAQWKGNGIERTFALSEHEIEITAQVCARLESEPDGRVRAISSSSPYTKPYWHLERARIPATRRIPVELIVNGHAVARLELEADGSVIPVHFRHHLERSSWIALRVYPSSHTNPLWLTLQEEPVRASRRSATWCRRAVDVCWEQKRLRIRPQELSAATAAYDHARATYDRIIQESFADGLYEDHDAVPSVFPVT